VPSAAYLVTVIDSVGVLAAAGWAATKAHNKPMTRATDKAIPRDFPVFTACHPFERFSRDSGLSQSSALGADWWGLQCAALETQQTGLDSGHKKSRRPSLEIPEWYREEGAGHKQVLASFSFPNTGGVQVSLHTVVRCIAALRPPAMVSTTR